MTCLKASNIDGENIHYLHKVGEGGLGHVTTIILA